MAPKIKLGDRTIYLPRNRLLRVGIGLLLIIFGILGFLPIVGYWMIPLGLLVLSVDVAIARRWRRRLLIWWERRRRTGQSGSGEAANGETDRPTVKYD